MIAIIDYKAGNLTSVKLALDSIGVEGVVTSDPEVIRSSPRVIFPGVGAAGAAMSTLQEAGLESCIRDVVVQGTPFLGICVGTQILLERSEEDGGVDCLGLIPGEVRMFRPEKDSDKVPQMGWNTVSLVRPHPLFEGIESDSEFYFVHSYYPAPEEEDVVLTRTDYAGVSFSSALARQNLVATQFHPEKSGRVGLRLLRNFSEWDGHAE